MWCEPYGVPDADREPEPTAYDLGASISTLRGLDMVRPDRIAALGARLVDIGCSKHLTEG